MIRLMRKASVWMRLARRWATVVSFSATSVSASSPIAPMGVFSSWLTLATKSRRISSRRRRSDTSSMAAITPEGAPAVVDELGRHGQGAAGRPVEVERAVRRALLPGVGEKIGHGFGRQRVTVAPAHEPDGARVAEHDRHRSRRTR